MSVLGVPFKYDDIREGTGMSVDEYLMLGLVKKNDDEIRFDPVYAHSKRKWLWFVDKPETEALIRLGYVVMLEGAPRITKQGKKVFDLTERRSAVWWALNRWRLEPKSDYKPPPKEPYPDGEPK